MELEKKNIDRTARKILRKYIEDRKKQERLTTSYPARKPENLTTEFLKVNSPSEIDVKLWKDATYHITNTIISEQNKDGYIPDPTLFVQMSSRTLRRIIGPYDTVIDRLVELGIIECDNQYTPGVKSRAYRLSKKYRYKKYVFREITHKSIVEGIRNRNIEWLNEQQKKLLPLSHLVRWTLENKLHIDRDEALQYLQEDYKLRMKRELESRTLKLKYKQQIDRIINERYEYAIRQIEDFDNVKLTVDNSGGRLYTNVTGMMSPLRNFLTYNGEELVNIDLRNSQPLHFLVMREKAFWKSTGKITDITLKNLNSELFEYLRERYTTHSLYIMLQKKKETLQKQGFQDVYKTLVLAGKLYEFKLAAFKGELIVDGIDRFGTRSKAKKECLKLMYFDNKNRYSPSQQSFTLFKKHFPFEADIMELLKERNYRDFPVMLQRIEARILLHIVCREVFEDDHTIPLFTVHDSILTTKRHVNTVLRIIERVYNNILGAIPQVEIQEMNKFEAWEGVRKYVRDKIDQARIDMVLKTDDKSEDSNVRKLKRRRSIEIPVNEIMNSLIETKQAHIDEEVLAQTGITFPLEFEQKKFSASNSTRKLRK